VVRAILGGDPGCDPSARRWARNRPTASITSAAKRFYGYPRSVLIARSGVDAPHPPPAPRPNDPAAPASNAVPGARLLDLRHRQFYSWNSVHWEIPPPYAASYVAAHWENRGDRYVSSSRSYPPPGSDDSPRRAFERIAPALFV